MAIGVAAMEFFDGAKSYVAFGAFVLFYSFLIAVCLLGSGAGCFVLGSKAGNSGPGFDTDWVTLQAKSCSCCLAISIKSSVLPF